MEEEKKNETVVETKVVKKKSGKKVCIILIIVLILAIGGVGYFGYLKHTEIQDNNKQAIEKLKQEKGELQNQIDQLLTNTQELNQTISKMNERINKTTVIKANAQYKELTKNLGENEGLYITSISKDTEGKYLIKGVKFEEYTLTAGEVNKLKDGARIIIDGKEYFIGNAEQPNTLRANGSEVDVLTIVEKDGKYILKGSTEYSVIRKMTDEYLTVTVDGNVKYLPIITDAGVETAEEKTMEQLFNGFKYVEPKDITHPSGLYKVTFENSKCVKISYLPTGH